jgi:hypothetical protein
MHNMKEKVAGEMAIRSMNEKAQEFYAGTDPLTVFEYDTENGKRYKIIGALGSRDDMTFTELEEMFTELYDELNTEEDA